MPDLTYLHIQERESDPTRVVALPGTAVRVGRGPHCEICLPEPALAEVQCILRRRGGEWQVQPVGPSGHLLLQGEPVDHLRPWPYGSTLQVGGFSLVMRPSEFGTYQSLYEVNNGFGISRSVDPRDTQQTRQTTPPPKIAPLVTDSNDLDVERLKRWQARLEQRERFLQVRQDEKKWEARWKAAGEGLRARTNSTAPSSRPAPHEPLKKAPPRPRSAPPTPPPPAPEPPRQSTSLRVSETPIARILQTTRQSQPQISLEPPAPAEVPQLVIAPEPPAPEPIIALPMIIAEPEVELEPVQESVAIVILPEVEPEPPHAIEVEIVVEAVVVEPEVEVEETVEDEPETVVEVREHEIILPIEKSILREGERSDPIWEQPAHFVANVASTSSDVWHEVTLPPHAPIVEPTPERVAPAPPQTHAPAPPQSHAPAPPRQTVAPAPLKEAGTRDEYPSAASIFAAQGARVAAPSESGDAQIGRKKKPRRHVPQPTVALAPEAWVMPSWLAAPPVAVVCVALVGVGAALSFFWTKDGGDTAMAARAALRPEDGRVVPLLDPTVRPETTWWKTTPLHMSEWGMAIARSPDGPERAAEVTELLKTATSVSPLQREARFALATDAATSSDPVVRLPRTLGLSRDVVSLTLTARSLKLAGKKTAAINAYRAAMDLASDADLEQLDAPKFDEDPRVRRYCLPHESLVQAVARDMADAGEWSFDDWKQAIPTRPVARLAVARVLREKGGADVDAVYNLVLADDVSLPRVRNLYAENLAAQAEALAFKEKKVEAAEQYRKAIELVSDDATKRRWRFGLAEIVAQLGDTKERAELLEAAKGLDPTEDVTKKAIDVQKFAGLR